jgi:hypothetical protein
VFLEGFAHLAQSALRDPWLQQLKQWLAMLPAVSFETKVRAYA